MTFLVFEILGLLRNYNDLNLMEQVFSIFVILILSRTAHTAWPAVTSNL